MKDSYRQFFGVPARISRQPQATIVPRDGVAHREIDAVLPLRLSDWERFRILDASIKKFFLDLRVCWIVVRDREYAELASRIEGPRYRIIPERKVVPECRLFEGVSGWFKQQLIKIAIAETTETEFYVTLDADVVCTKILRHSDLIKHGRAGCFVQSSDIHAEWYEWAERVLAVGRSGASHAVTPTVYAREAVLKLQRYLSRRFNPKNPSNGWGWMQLIPRIKKPPSTPEYPRPWALYLLQNLPWTEHSLYYTFLEATGQFARYHFRAPTCLYSAHSLWEKTQIPSWDPRISMENEGSSFFLVVQSNTGIDPQVVREKLGTLLRLDAHASGAATD